MALRLEGHNSLFLLCPTNFIVKVGRSWFKSNVSLNRAWYLRLFESAQAQCIGDNLVRNDLERFAGDGWTPLMAATVADRQAVAKVVLDFALSSREHHEETESSKLDQVNKPIGSRISAPPLVDAQNRYGQSALHIAARKASTWFVDCLLNVGASLDVRDNYGLRPIDVARSLRHSAIEESLKKWQETHAKSTTGGNSGKTSRKRKSKLKKAAAAAEENSNASAEANSAAEEQEKMRADVQALEASIHEFHEVEYAAEVLAGPGDKELSLGSLSM